MQLLLLYWSFIIIMYIVAFKFADKSRDYSFLDKALNIMIYILVLFMGMGMGANKEVTSSLGTIGLSSIIVSAMTITGSMFFVFIARKLLKRNRYGLKANEIIAVEEQKESSKDTASNSHGMKTTVYIMCFVALGMALGYLLIPKLFTDIELFYSISDKVLVVSLCTLLGMVGFSLGLRGNIFDGLKTMGISIVVIPCFAVLGTIAAGVVYGLLSQFSVREAVAISAGFGWYTLAPTMITEAGFAVAGAVSFLHNVIRETLGIIIIPFAASKIGYVESTSIPGVAAMDVCLPIVEKCTNQETVLYSFCTGLLMCIAVPTIVPLVL